jgi:hypothetical protein
MTELMTIGFKDRTEILVSIRKLAETPRGEHPPPPHHQLTADEVMCDIVAMREEAEFARDMDRARLESERDRRKDAEDRRKIMAAQQEDELANATVSQWLENKEMFMGSWLLKSELRGVIMLNVTKTKSPLKKKLIELLKLEKQSRKWYGSVLPRAYFEEVLVSRLCRFEDATRLEAEIELETNTLNEGLTLLSNQQGMVPRIFAEAHDAAKQRAGYDDGDKDDEVIVLETRITSDASPQNKKPRLSGQGGSETIEIL